jgi:hypothetical protein
MCHAIAAHIFGQKQNVTEEEKHSNATFSNKRRHTFSLLIISSFFFVYSGSDSFEENGNFDGSV